MPRVKDILRKAECRRHAAEPRPWACRSYSPASILSLSATTRSVMFRATRKKLRAALKCSLLIIIVPVCDRISALHSSFEFRNLLNSRLGRRRMANVKPGCGPVLSSRYQVYSSVLSASQETHARFTCGRPPPAAKILQCSSPQGPRFVIDHTSVWPSRCVPISGSHPCMIERIC